MGSFRAGQIASFSHQQEENQTRGRSEGTVAEIAYKQRKLETDLDQGDAWLAAGKTNDARSRHYKLA